MGLLDDTGEPACTRASALGLCVEREDAVLQAFSFPSAFSGEEGVCGRKGRDDNYLLSPTLLRSEEGELVPQPHRRKVAQEYKLSHTVSWLCFPSPASITQPEV